MPEQTMFGFASGKVNGQERAGHRARATAQPIDMGIVVARVRSQSFFLFSSGIVRYFAACGSTRLMAVKSADGHGILFGAEYSTVTVGFSCTTFPPWLSPGHPVCDSRSGSMMATDSTVTRGVGVLPGMELV